MSVSTGSTQASWPPIDESADGNPEITLPSDLYWRYIYPSTASTTASSSTSKRGARNSMRGDASSSMRRRTLEEKGKEDALALLRKARRAWDIHLSMMDSPSERLQACLDLLCEDTEEDEDYRGSTVLFPGAGKTDDVLRLHVAMDPKSINGPPAQYVFPNTLLGHLIDGYLAEVIGTIMEDFVVATPEATMRDAIVALLDAGADVSPFFETLQEIPPVQTVDFATGRFHGAFYLRLVTPGSNAVQCMKEFSASFENPDTGDMGIDELDWVIEQLEIGIFMSRFFEVALEYGLLAEPGAFVLPATPEDTPRSLMSSIADDLKIDVSEVETPGQTLKYTLVDLWNFVRDPRSSGDRRKVQVFYHPDFDPNNLPTRPLRKLDEDEEKVALARFRPPHGLEERPTTKRPRLQCDE